MKIQNGRLRELLRRKDWAGLREAAREQRVQLPASTELLTLELRALEHLGQKPEAVRCGVEFLQTYGNRGEVYDLLEGLVAACYDWDVGLIRAMEAIGTRRAEALKIRALVAMRNGVEAVQAFGAAVDSDGRVGPLTRRQLAKLLAKAQLWEQATVVYWQALAEDPEDRLGWRELVEALIELADFEFPEYLNDARGLAQALRRRFPDDAEAALSVGLYWRAASRADRAFPLLEEYFREHPQDLFRAAHAFDVLYVDSIPYEKQDAVIRGWSELIYRKGCHYKAEVERPRDPERRLRVGYYSPDLGKHPVGYFALPVLREHDPEAVELYLYSQRDPVGEDDEISKQFRALCGAERWRWVKPLTTEQAVEQIRRDGIDVLVDLAGHSANNRLDIFGNRVAPVQVHWLGYAGSTQMPMMDYRISDAIVEPEGQAERWSSEEIVRLPNGFHAIEMPADLPEPVEPPILRNGYLTFGSFNNVNKLGARTLRLWAELLAALPESRLLLKHRTMEVFENRENIRSQFALHGVDPGRVRFRGVTRRREDHFQHYGEMDIALDPYGYNGTTTTCEALYMGVPVLTLPGERHAARVSASLLHRVGMDGWVARDRGHYRRIAQAAAARPEALAQRRRRLRQDFLDSPLSDGRGLARDLEAAYRKMWHQYCFSPRKVEETT